MNVLLFGLFLLSIVSYCYAINVTQCHDNENPTPDLNNRVKVGNCKKPPCRLRKNSSIQIVLKVTPEKDVEKLTNTIHAYIAGVPFPFVGHDQADACDRMYDADGKEKVSCPLKAGQDYIYKENIDILQIYPRVKAVVHWGLTQADGKDLLCFEVPARITN